MKVKAVQSSWIVGEARRLDCGPYINGAIEARQLLNRLKVRADRLDSLTSGYNGGIYNGPQFRRNYVDTPDYGVPFLTSGSVLLADLTTLPLLSRKDAESDRLCYLQLRKGMTLISCSGTIGRMTYARPDMDGIWSSQDVMKVVADESKIPSGYLYAFLASKYGVPLVISRTYGAIIPHLESHHLADLPVPRLGTEIEGQARTLVEKAATNRSLAARLRLQAQQTFRRLFDLTDLNQESTTTVFGVFSVSSTQLRRLDATYFSPACAKAEAELGIAGRSASHLAGVAQVFTPGIFKRRHVDDPSYGYAYYSGSELFQINPEPRGYLSRKAPAIEDYIVYRDWLLIQDAGQLGGLIGRVTRVPSHVDGGVVSNHLMRVVASGMPDAAYLFTILNSPHGYRAITRHAFGSSIPQLDPSHIGAIKIPWPDANIRLQIAQPIIESWALEDAASEFELKAITIVEQAIEGAA